VRGGKCRELRIRAVELPVSSPRIHRLVMRFLLKNHPSSVYLRETLPLLEPVDIPEDADVVTAESAL
jgi:hypothetical protein